MLQLIVYAAAYPLSHGLCAVAKLGQMRLHAHTTLLNNWSSNTLGSAKYHQPTAVRSQTHSLRHQFGEDTLWRYNV